MGNLGLTDAQKQDQAEIIAALRQHVEGKINETVERRNLRQRTQLIGESFDDFLVALRELAKTCNFCNNDCLQKALRDQIIEGLSDGEAIQELLQIQDLTLDAAVTKCRGLGLDLTSKGQQKSTPSEEHQHPWIAGSRTHMLRHALVVAIDHMLVVGKTALPKANHATDVEKWDTLAESAENRVVVTRSHRLTHSGYTTHQTTQLNSPI